MFFVWCRHRKIKAANQNKSKSSGKKDKESEKEKSDKDKGERAEKEEKKIERQQSRHGRSSVPFHRKQANIQEDVLQFDMERVMSHLPPNPAFLPTGSTTIPPQGGTPVPEGAIDTPNSAPSPLDPPPNLPSLEPTMPTLSPQPPSKFPGGTGGAPNGSSSAPPGGQGTPTANNANGNPASAGGGGGGGAGAAENSTATPTGGVQSEGDKDFPNCPSAATAGADAEQTAEESVNPLPHGSSNSEFLPKNGELTSGQGASTPQPRAASATAATAGGAGNGVPAPPDSQLPWSAKKELVSNWLQSQQKCVDSVLKRPLLPSADSDEEGDLVTRTFYDEQSVKAW